MRDITFYREFQNRSKTKPTGNVLAVIRENRCPDGSMEAMGALFDRANSPVVTTAASGDYLREKCKRVSEAKARQVHPALFERLDQAD
jgi:hypothetical protein